MQIKQLACLRLFATSRCVGPCLLAEEVPIETTNRGTGLRVQLHEGKNERSSHSESVRVKSSRDEARQNETRRAVHHFLASRRFLNELYL